MSESGIQPDPPAEQPSPAPGAGPPAPLTRELELRRPDSPLAIIVPYRNPRALAAYYCAVFSILPVTALILAPLAVVLGIAGLRRARRDPHARGAGHAWFAIVLGGLMALLNWGVVGYGIWAMNYDTEFQQIYHELFDTPPPRPEPEEE